jgi:hypothetical protein
VYNFFHGVRSAASGIYQANKATPITRAHALDGSAIEKQNVIRNPQFIGTYAARRNFYKKSRHRKNLCCGVVPALFAHARRSRGTRRLHTKLSGVTVIFFPL